MFRILQKVCLLTVCILTTAGLLAQPREIALTTLPGLQFDKVQIAVKPGEKIRIVFTNRDDMSHNLLIVKPGKREAVVQAAADLAEKGPALNYIPASEEIIGSIPVISPGQTSSVTFTVPAAEGAYPYVCTYPGHGFVMYGVLHVSKSLKMPQMKDDPDVPDSRKIDAAAHAHHEHRNHPYDPVPPFLYRAFMEGSGLASIAVRLPHQLAFCWDAQACKLQYAWSGDFLDMKDFWHGHKNAYAKVLGDIFYRDRMDHPLRTGNPKLPPSVKFKGYRLVNRYPEFRYLVNGVEVFELIREKPDGSGLERLFRIPGQLEPVWFHFGQDGMLYDFSAGTRESDGVVKLSPGEAAEFTVTMTRSKE